MIDHRESQSRPAAVALVVLLLHVALAWLVLLALRIPRTAPQDGGALQAVILPPDHTGSPEKPLPKIKPDLRMPDPPVPDFALEIPIVMPLEVTNPQAVNPQLSATASVLAPEAAGEGGHDSSHGAAAGEGTAGTNLMRGMFPVYPRRSVVQREEGSVVAALTFNSSGTLRDVRVQQSSGFAGLDAAALHALRQWRVECAHRGQPCAITLRVGFGLASRPPPKVEPALLEFDAGWVARINAAARLSLDKSHSTPEARRLIATMIETLASAMYPDASDPGAERRSPRVYVIREHGPIHLSGTPPWPRMLDPSPVLNVRFMGVVDLMDPEVDGVSGRSRSWYAFAVQQENSTSEWLLGPPGPDIRRVEVIAGGPSCTDAPGSVACIVDP